MGNSSLTRARVNMNDEFYTQLVTIENELKYYEGKFMNKVVYLNCDDARWSNFYKFFHNNFDELGLKGLYSSHYVKQEINLLNVEEELSKSLATYYDGDIIQGWWMKGDGDFRSEESIELLSQADIVVTNPPFSLFREFTALMMEYDKKFLVIGSANAAGYKNVFPLIKGNKMWQGISSGKMEFRVPEDNGNTNIYERDGELFAEFGNIVWWTNIKYKRRYKDIDLFREYKGNESNYPRYINYEAINIDRVVDIPEDYSGVMGVPISIIGKWNPNQFDIIGLSSDREMYGGELDKLENLTSKGEPTGTLRPMGVYLNHKKEDGIPRLRHPESHEFYRNIYTRVFIRNKYLNPEIYEKDTEDGSANTEGEEI